MSFLLSMEMYNEVFDKSEKRTLSQRFLESLRHFLSESDNEMEKSMLAWIDDGGNIAAFRCSNDIYDDMADTMCVNAIPCVRTIANNGKTGLIIRNCDKERTEKAIEETLERTSHVFVQMNETGFKEYISKLRDAKAVSFYGLTEIEAEMLIEKLGKILKVDVAEYSLMEDGSYRISIPGKDVLKRGYKREKLTQLLLQIQLNLSGKNKNVVSNKIKIRLEAEAAALKASNGKNLQGKELFLAGDNRAYIRYDEYGFAYGRAEEINGQIAMSDEEFVSRNETRYEAMEATCRSLIAYPIATHSAVEAINYLQTGFQTHVLAGKEKMIETGEALLAEKIDRIAEERLSYTDIPHRSANWCERLTSIQKETGEILSAAITGHVPEGYSIDEIQEIRDIATKYCINLADYATVAEKMLNPEIYQENTRQTGLILDDIREKSLPETEKQAMEEKRQAREDLGL